MKKIIPEFLSALPISARIFVALYVLGFPIALLGEKTHAFELYQWLALIPTLVWKGQLWRLLTYIFLPLGVVDWVVSMFWLFTLVSVMRRNWTGRGFWAYCLLSAVVGGICAVLAAPRAHLIAGNSAVLFALLVAWDRLYRRERLLLLGIGEISVRQAAILVGIIDILILLFCAGPFLTVAMLCGGVAGWLYLVIASKLVMVKSAVPSRSERIARLEI